MKMFVMLLVDLYKDAINSAEKDSEIERQIKDLIEMKKIQD